METYIFYFSAKNLFSYIIKSFPSFSAAQAFAVSSAADSFECYVEEG